MSRGESASSVSSSQSRGSRERCHEGAPKKYQCDECGKEFARKKNVDNHKKTHDGARERPYVCQTNGCSHTFDRRADLERHVNVSKSAGYGY